jgi:transcriptional regulator
MRYAILWESTMFVPPLFQEHDLAILHGLIEEIRLGTLITAGHERGIVGSHIPFLLDASRSAHGTLIGHVDRRNEQWRALENGDEVLVMFLGPDSPVAAGWYGSEPRVPTWLYVAVHAYGRPVMVSDAAELRRMVVDMSMAMEPASSAWAPGQVDQYIDRLMAGIVGFEIPIDRLEGQLRLGQQNTQADRQRVHDSLASGTPRQTQVAELMQRLTVCPRTNG